jgi:hypothetical protein
MQINSSPSLLNLGSGDRQQALHRFLETLREEQFQRHYFQEVPVEVMSAVARGQSTG